MTCFTVKAERFILIWGVVMFLLNNHFLTTLFLLFPFTSNLPVVLHLVREPFLTRCSKTAAACSEGLFSCSDFGYCTLRMSEKQVFHIRHIRFYYVIDKEYTD